MRKTRSVCCFLVGVVAAFALARWATGARAEAPEAGGSAAAFTPVQPIHVMMEGQKKLRKEIQAGILDKEWKDAMKAAWILAEIANVNQYQNDHPQYKAYAKRMSDQCVKLAKLLRKRKDKEARALFKEIGQTCSACHDQFREE